MKIVGLGHYSRTGKDSFANAAIEWLKAHTKLKVKKLSFAWKLKQICFELYAWDGMREPEFYETEEGAPFRDIKLPTIGMTPVEIWVAMGTPAVRERVYDKTWIYYLLRTKHDLDIVFIPDVRFHNEVDAVRESGGTLHKIVRPGYGPRNTVADRALIDYRGWDFVWGEHGDFDRLCTEAYQFAAALVGMGDMPVQTDAEKAAKLSVEQYPVFAQKYAA